MWKNNQVSMKTLYFRTLYNIFEFKKTLRILLHLFNTERDVNLEVVKNGRCKYI